MTRGIVSVAVLGMLAFASSAQGLILTGGPSYTLPGGGSCTISGQPGVGAGATVSCTGINLGAHTKVYYGIKNDTNVNGNALDGSGPSAGEIYRFQSSAADSITYTSASTINNVLGSSTQAVSNRLTITRTAGAATLVATGGNPSDNGNGDIQRLYQITGGSTLTLDVDAESSTTGIVGFGISNPHVYNPVHTPLAATVDDIVRVDLAFYWSDCGDGVVDSPEQCDEGGNNGSSSSCCTSTCTFRTAGAVCRSSTGECDPQEVCTGSSGTCPLNQFTAAGTQCTDTSPPPLGDCKDAQCDGGGNCVQAFTDEPNGTSCSDGLFCNGTDTCSAGACGVHTGDPCTGPDGDNNCMESCDEAADNCLGPDPNGAACDDNLFCNGADECASGTCSVHAGDPCPGPDLDTNCAESCSEALNNCTADDPNGSVCRPAAGTCDIVESCSSGTCPTDAFEIAGTVCRPGSGDVCDPTETCTGSSAACPVDVVTPAGTVCNAGSGDLCDPDEQCTGNPTDPCPSDVIASAGTVCNAGSGDLCDPDEVCSGVAEDPCPSDTVASAGTICNPGSGDLCDPDEVCSGTAGDPCPTDTIASAGTVCDPGSGDSCDPDEVCSGTADDPCPTDTVASAGTICDPGSGDMCDPHETCSGTPGDPCPTDTFEAASTVCRGSAFSCDAVEFCPGAADVGCPGDLLELDGTSCNDGDPCTQSTTCSAGSCQGGVPALCVDHFKCYKAKDLKQPKFAATTMTLADQFGLIHDDNVFQLKKPFLVCNPTDKDNEGINNPNDHLTCYKVRGADGRIDKSQRPHVEAINQFGSVQLELKKAFVVCVPSAKSVLP